MSFASCSESSPSIWARPPPMPPDRLESGVVDLREGLDLAVEDDGEVLRLLAQLPADPLVAGDLLELRRTVAVNSIVTIGWLPAAPGLVSKSARVPESLRSSPVICGMFGGSYLKR